MAEERNFEAEYYRLRKWLRVLGVVLALSLGVIVVLLATKADSASDRVSQDQVSVWTESFIEEDRQREQRSRKNREARAQRRRSLAQERELMARQLEPRRAIGSRDPEKAKGILQVILRANGEPYPEETTVYIHRVGEPGEFGGSTPDGERTFYGLQPGRYVVRVTDSKREKMRRSEVQVRADRKATISIDLGVLASEESSTRLSERVSFIFGNLHIRDKVRLGTPELKRDPKGGSRIRLEVTFLKREGYRIEDLLLVVRTIERKSPTTRVVEMDFGSLDGWPDGAWRPGHLVIHKTAVTQTQAQGREMRQTGPPTVLGVIERLQKAMAGFRSDNPDWVESRAVRLKVAPGRLDLSLRVPSHEVVAEKIQMLFEGWPGYKDLVFGQVQRLETGEEIRELVVSWKP